MRCFKAVADRMSTCRASTERIWGLRKNELNWMPETGEKINSDGAKCKACSGRCRAQDPWGWSSLTPDGSLSLCSVP